MEANASKLVGGWEAERRSARLRWPPQRVGPSFRVVCLPAAGGRKGGAVFC